MFRTYPTRDRGLTSVQYLNSISHFCWISGYWKYLCFFNLRTLFNQFRFSWHPHSGCFGGVWGGTGMQKNKWNLTNYPMDYDNLLVKKRGDAKTWICFNLICSLARRPSVGSSLVNTATKSWTPSISTFSHLKIWFLT